MDIFKPNLIQFETQDQLYKSATALVLDNIIDSQNEEGVSRVALTGGNTPKKLYQLIAKENGIDWSRVEFYQTDERYVDQNSIDSNQKMILETIGEEIITHQSDFRRIDTSMDISLTVESYNEQINNLDGTLFDVVILGVGTDGHIASLFPNQNYLSHQEKKVIKTTATNGHNIKDRITLTIESILNSKAIILLITGEDKAFIINEILEGKKLAQEFPVKFLLAHPNLSIFYTDSNE
jgi:6-phosphogluconolactonase